MLRYAHGPGDHITAARGTRAPRPRAGSASSPLATASNAASSARSGSCTSIGSSSPSSSESDESSSETSSGGSPSPSSSSSSSSPALPLFFGVRSMLMFVSTPRSSVSMAPSLLFLALVAFPVLRRIIAFISLTLSLDGLVPAASFSSALRHLGPHLAMALATLSSFAWWTFSSAASLAAALSCRSLMYEGELMMTPSALTLRLLRMGAWVGTSWTGFSSIQLRVVSSSFSRAHMRARSASRFCLISAWMLRRVSPFS
mmetsp:Transcript_23495/g.54181  ORF Transcript_23495/g.54181 Transcript_23495/m.54181 type:complete len:258 (+) Transcript_23495:82-855(+)